MDSHAPQLDTGIGPGITDDVFFMFLAEKITIVTGASRGVGRSIALRLGAEGAIVAICARTEKELAEVCEAIARGGGCCQYAVVDVTRMKQVKRFVADILGRWNRIDVLINNAGFCAPVRPVEKVTDEEYKQSLAVNLEGVFHFTRAVLPIMRTQNSGTMITISSACGRQGYPGLSLYSASKFAVQGFLESVAGELRGSAIRSAVINPGAVATRMRSDLFGEEEARRHQSPEAVAEIVRDILIGRISVPHGGGACVRDGKVTEVYGPSV